jgi:hypothetical protein
LCSLLHPTKKCCLQFHKIADDGIHALPPSGLAEVLKGEVPPFQGVVDLVALQRHAAGKFHSAHINLTVEGCSVRVASKPNY